MQALVLAAGCGSRMKALTRHGPKCLLSVAGTTLLDRQLAVYRALGVTRVAAVGGWQAQALRAHDVEVIDNPDWERGTMVGSLCRAGAWLARDVTLVSYGDIAFSPATARRLAETDAPLAVAYDEGWRALWSRRFANPLDDAETFALDEDGHVADIGRRVGPDDRVDGQYIGLTRWTPEAWARFGPLLEDLQGTEEGRRVDMTAALRRLVDDHGAAIAGVPVDGPWFEFDSARDVELGGPVVQDIDRLLGAMA